MEFATIQAQARTRQAHHGNERLRRAGLTPAIVYGHGKPPEMLALSQHDLEFALAHGQHVVKVVTDGREEQYLLKDVQFDHLHKTPLHVDLMRVDVSERVKVKVPLELRGTPRGAQEGGTLVSVLTEFEIECLVLNIPDTLRVRVDHLGLNESLKARDVELPADVKMLHSPDDIVVVVQPPRAAVEAPTAAAEASEGAAEPEIIAKGKEEKEGEAGA